MIDYTDNYNTPYDKDRIEVYTDASFCPKKKIGSYAFCINTIESYFKEKGYFNVKINNSTHAELKCIIEALFFIKKNNIYESKRSIYIYTDSKSAISMIKKSKEEKSIIINDYLKFLSGLTIRFLHVKSHKDSNNKHTYNNYWCDMSAKEQLDILREKKGEKQNG